jgi:hypothetical protein
VAGTDIPDIWAKASIDPSQLSDTELARFAFHLLSYLKQFEHAFIQHQLGNLSDSSWEGIHYLFRNSVLTSIGVRRYWQRRQNGFQHEFREYVNAAIPEEEAVTSSELINMIKETGD